jgi:hypothetical protein
MPADRRSALSVDEVELAAPLTREEQRVRFQFHSTARRRFERLAVTLETALGTLRAELPGGALGVTEREGVAELPLALGLLPAGPAVLTLTPIDRAGRPGTSGTASFEVPGDERVGDAPQLIDVRAERDVLRRPDRPDDWVAARVHISARPGGQPIASVHIAAVTADGAESGVLFPPSSPEGFEPVETTATLLDSTAALGAYELRVTVVDAAGRTSETLAAVVTLTDDAGAPSGPRVDRVEPSEAAAGDTVQISGAGFEARELTVEVASVAAQVLEIAPDRIAFAMPDIDSAGRVVVRTAEGAGSSEGELTPRVTVDIVPAEFEIHEGGEVQLVALVRGTADRRVIWTADPTRATIDATGRLTLGFSGRPGRIAVRANSVVAPESPASAAGRVVPLPPSEGPVAVGAHGGTVLDATGGLRLTVPRGALAEPATIVLRHVPGGSDPDWTVAAEAAIEPSGRELDRPTRLEIPLRVWHDPGARLSVKHRVDPSDPWEDVEKPAIVDPTGFVARLELDRFGMVRLDKPFPMLDVVVSPLPAITGIAPPVIEEGATVALLVTGKNFVPGFTSVVGVHANLAPDPRMQVRGGAVTVDGTKLATTVKAGVMTDLAEGATRQYRLLVITPAGSDEVPITVLGRDELDVTSGTRTLSTSRRFSRMDIGPNGRVVITSTHPPVAIDVNERASIASRFTTGGGVISRAAAGGNGTPGDVPGTAGGGGGGGSGTGPAGLGRGGAGGVAGSNGNTAGASGSVGTASVTQTGAGAGGAGGLGGGGGLHSHRGGDGTPGSGGQRTLAPFIPAIIEAGPGGGGGGGGGGEGWVWTQTGGGGGGGGAGGGAFRISAGEELRLAGDVFALGGDGGVGAYPTTTVGIPPVPEIAAGRGGGGGGGAGGAIELSGVRWLAGPLIVAVGGQNRSVPSYGSAPAGVSPLQTILRQPPTGVIRIDGQRPSLTFPTTAVPGPDLDYRHELVSTSPQLVVSGFDADQVRVLDRFGNVRTHATSVYGGAFTCSVTLFDGFNDISADIALGTATAAMSNAGIRTRTVIYLANTVSSYSFSCSITPGQVTVPTERSVTLSASVTASQPSPIEWGLTGSGPDWGTVVGLPGNQARYTAPCSAPAQPVFAVAASRLVPTFSCRTQVNVVAGVSVASTAVVGTPADAAVASANVGQTITIAIPAAVFTQTNQGFVAGDAATFRLVQRSATGQCQESTVPIQGTVGTGTTSLDVAVPACAHPDQQIRVSGHGCVRLLVVPTITSLDLDPAIAPGMLIKGTGFVCGATTINVDGGDVPAGSIVSVTCGLIHLATRPAPNVKIYVTTAGGTSNIVAA